MNRIAHRVIIFSRPGIWNVERMTRFSGINDVRTQRVLDPGIVTTPFGTLSPIPWYRAIVFGCMYPNGAMTRLNQLGPSNLLGASIIGALASRNFSCMISECAAARASATGCKELKAGSTSRAVVRTPVHSGVPVAGAGDSGRVPPPEIYSTPCFNRVKMLTCVLPKAPSGTVALLMKSKV